MEEDEALGTHSELTNEAKDPSGLTNKSLIKATVILRTLGLFPQGITASELATEVGMSRPTTFRLLLSLEQAGFADRIGNRYVLGWEMARLGKLADPYKGLASRVQPILDSLTAELNESSTLSVPTGELDFELVAEAVGSRMLTIQQFVGQKYPLHASATGKVLLAELPDSRIKRLLPQRLDALTPDTIVDREELITQLHQIRKQGYSTLDNELEEELYALACPVRSAEGALIGIVSVNGPRQRLRTDRLPATIARLLSAADEIAQALN